MPVSFPVKVLTRTTTCIPIADIFENGAAAADTFGPGVSCLAAAVAVMVVVNRQEVDTCFHYAFRAAEALGSHQDHN